MSHKENSEIASAQRLRKFAKVAMIAFIVFWFAIIPLATIIAFLTGLSIFVATGLLFVLSLLLILSIGAMLVFFLIVLPTQPGIPAVILRNRHYVGEVEKAGLYLKSQIMNSAIAYENKVMSERDPRNMSQLRAMLIDQGKGSTEKGNRYSPRLATLRCHRRYIWE